MIPPFARHGNGFYTFIFFLWSAIGVIIGNEFGTDSAFGKSNPNLLCMIAFLINLILTVLFLHTDNTDFKD